MAGDITTINVGITFSTKPAVLDLQVVVTDKGTGNSTVATLDDDIYESSSTLYNAVITFAESGTGVTITVSNTGFRTVTIEQSGYAKDVDVTLEEDSTNGIYSGSQKIASVFYGSQKIAFVFHGSQLVFGKRTKTFNVSSGIQSWVVPNGVKSLTVDCVASKGADSEDGNLAGGKGGRVKCNLKVTPGQTLYFMVGKIPTNAGTVSYNASDIRIGGTEYSNRVLVAGGGGSAAWRNGHGATGGAGGGTTGGAGVQDTTGGGAAPGQGGTQSAGGSGGAVHVSGSVWSSPGRDGQLGLGGTSDNHGYHFSIGGVGGAGYYGGGGGAGFHTSKVNRASGGGGGSSFANTSYCSSVSHTQGYNNGDGYITIEFTQDITGGGTVVPDPDPEEPEITSITYYCFTADDMYFDINGAPAEYFYLTDLSNGAKGPVYAKRSNGFNPFYFNEDDAAGYGKVTTSPSSGADYGYKITNPTSGDWMEVSFFRSPDNDKTVLVTG